MIDAKKDGLIKLTKKIRAEIESMITNELADRGLRTLALAYRDLDEGEKVIVFGSIFYVIVNCSIVVI